MLDSELWKGAGLQAGSLLVNQQRATTQPPHCQLHETEMFLKTPAACQARVQRLRACLTLL